MNHQPTVLILYYSRHGSVKAMAEAIAMGVEQQQVIARIRTVPSLNHDQQGQTEPAHHALVTLDDLATCDGLILGSPSRFGNMAAPMKQFWETTSNTWLNGELIDKPASVFTASSSLHGGNESTLLTMMIPLLHHGMIIQGLPYTEPSLHQTTTGGTPYGASHVSGMTSNATLTLDEKTLCQAQGRRMGLLVKQLQQP